MEGSSRGRGHELVRCLGPGCDRTFLSADRRKNRICPVCTKKLKQTTDGKTRARPIYMNGKRLTFPGW